MPSWTEPRRCREAINVANHTHGWNPGTRVVGGVDDPSLSLLTSAETLTSVWSMDSCVHLLLASEWTDDHRRN